jgi:hypothetical protein
MDLGFLRPLYDQPHDGQPGRYVSVYVDTSRSHENALRETGVRWQDAREQLAAEGADGRTLDAAAAALGDAGRTAEGCAAFARDGQLLLAEDLPHPPRRGIARLSVLPHVMPLLAQRSAHLPYLRVEARHDGGEIAAVGAAGGERDQEVAGSGWPVHMYSGGGSAQRRYEHSTEQAWDVNAKELAEQVKAAAASVGAGLILLSGDVRARGLLLEQLGHDLAAITVTVGQEIPAESDAAAHDADQAITAHIEQISRARYEHWRNQQAQGRGVAGLRATLTALRDGAVAELLIADDPSSTATAWIGPGPTDIAGDAADLTDRGVSDPVTERADAAIARALAMTSARLYFIPDDLDRPEDGVGALLRFPRDAAT